MNDLSRVIKIYEETDVDIANALLSTRKCCLLSVVTDGGSIRYSIGYYG